MGEPHNRRWRYPRAFLGTLIRDKRANTMAMMAMAFIPLAGMVGGGVDISRMYIVKTRLQHACDAGALAGRKTMGGGTWGYDNYASRTAAERFFDANYNSAAYGATDVTRTYTENAGKVMGTASATVPMTLMRVFGRTTETLSVTCDADMRLPNTDIMFVLDTTGSMDETPSGDTQTKIAGLRVAVKCFYEIVARLDTNATCVAGTPSGGTGNQVQVRFGFVPYSVNVNVGRLLPTSWFADTWDYQTREGVGTTTTTTTYPVTVDSTGPSGNASGQWSAYTNYGSQQWAGNCTNPGNSSVGPTTTSVDSTPTIDANGNRVWTTTTTVGTVETQYQIISVFYGLACQTQVRTRTTGTYTTVNHTAAPVVANTLNWTGWKYDKLPVNIGLLKNGTEWRDSFQWPIGPSGANKTITWDGCIEERKTTRTTNYDPIPTDAYDLNIDLVPTSDNDTKWKPALPGLIHTRNGTNSRDWTLSATNNTTSDWGNGSSYACPTAARKLQTWPDATAFDAYVDSLSTGGNTFHDIGLLWGARLASPTGLFKADNEYTPKGGEIERHIIFMTDGDTNTSASNYTAYGVPWFDRRQTDAGTVPTTTLLDQQVDLRFAALCKKIRDSNKFTLWVISFGSVSSDTETRLRNCATSGRYFSASNSATLQATFKSIADQISQLRLTK